MKFPNGRQASEGARPTLKPMSFWLWMFAAAAVFVITAVGVIIWLWAIAGHAKPGTDQASARLDAVRTGLAAGAGAGAAVGLVLAFRRQHHQEIATAWTDQDATERRITELYTKAVEQLGSDKAPVRLGGLYALERLAQDNPAHQQTIVNVICAYLRMPFSPTPPADKPQSEATEDQGQRGTKTQTRPDGNVDTWQQEKQVRFTAQRILADHLCDGWVRDKRTPGPRFWPDIDLDLAGATLIDFNFILGVVDRAYFEGATFTGDALFVEATFSSADFKGATFTGDAMFVEATFGSSAGFDGTTFGGRAGFVEATFGSSAGFHGATFDGLAVFRSATFNGQAEFGDASFSGEAEFDQATFNAAKFTGATFHGRATFGHATFSGLASFQAIFHNVAGFAGAIFRRAALFTRATFSSAAVFGGVAFNGIAEFTWAVFNSEAMFGDASFNGKAEFDRATFNGIVEFSGATFDSRITFDKATLSSDEAHFRFQRSSVLSPVAQHVWPTGWRLKSDGRGRSTVVRARSSDRS